MSDPDREDRRSALPWPMPVRPAPGRWTVLASAALMLAVGGCAIVIVIICM